MKNFFRRLKLRYLYIRQLKLINKNFSSFIMYTYLHEVSWFDKIDLNRCIDSIIDFNKALKERIEFVKKTSKLYDKQEPVIDLCEAVSKYLKCADEIDEVSDKYNRAELLIRNLDTIYYFKPNNSFFLGYSLFTKLFFANRHDVIKFFNSNFRLQESVENSIRNYCEKNPFINNSISIDEMSVDRLANITNPYELYGAIPPEYIRDRLLEKFKDHQLYSNHIIDLYNRFKYMEEN